MWVEGDVEGGCLDHDEDGMKDWTTATQENHWKQSKHWIPQLLKSIWNHTLAEQIKPKDKNPAVVSDTNVILC